MGVTTRERIAAEQARLKARTERLKEASRARKGPEPKQATSGRKGKEASPDFNVRPR